MNLQLQSNCALIHRIITRHLNLRHMSEGALSNKMGSVAGQASAARADALSTTPRGGAVLYILLLNYVDLLESDDHGGWTQEEDDVVREAIRELLRLGWNFQEAER